jgi:type VII secretion-associated serine protease mycosin
MHMGKRLGRATTGALAAGLAAAALAVPFAGEAESWTPVTRGLDAAPEAILPPTVSPARPVRVVSTVLDDSGRPVVTTRTATDRATAARLIRDGQQAPGAVAVELDAPVRALGVPTGSDPYRNLQWDLATIQAPAAWPTSTGAGVTVAVVDSGVDAEHPDLAGQVLPGTDLVTGTSGVSSDPNGHGTHVAGTIAALTGNGVGVAGFAPDAKILPVRVLAENGGGTMSAVATGITWAADHGAQVINMSLGGTAQVTAVTNAIAYARSKGVVVVAAAGNSRSAGSPVSYPAADPGVIAVAATDSADNVAPFSNQGTYVDVAAPGVNIPNTIPVSRGGYSYMSGTSMAAPHIAAVAALLKAHRPELDSDQVEQAMETSAVDLGTAGKDADFGYGRVDATAALAAAPAAGAPVTAPTSTSAVPSPTVAPTTVAPTTKPTTVAPTTKPTTVAPTTKPTTVAPTTKPTTVAPTAKPTTVAPTAKPTTVPPTAKPTTAPVKVTPTIKSDGVNRVVNYGSPTRTTFTVTAGGQPWARRPVQICMADNGAAVFQCRAATTSATGTVLVTRSATVPFRVRLVATATATSAATTSEPVTYRVRAVATPVKTNGRTMTVALAGVDRQAVEVQTLNGRKWTTVRTYRAITRYVLTNVRAGGQYRVVVPATATFAGATSATVRF